MRRTILSLLAFLVSGSAAFAADAVRTFPAYQCRYTLPGKDWSWGDPAAAPRAICVARNEDGLVFLVGVMPVPAGTALSAKFADGFGSRVHRGVTVTKRGGRLTTFRGLPCYEGEMLLNGTRTVAFRLVIANGFAYHIQLMGGADPVEKRPDFDAIMNGFEFTSPPVAPAPKSAADTPAPNSTADPPGDDKNPAYLAGQVLGYCAIGVFIVGLTRWGQRRK
jgi:hypothetical protein